MKLFKSKINAGLIRIGRQAIDLAGENASSDEFGPRLFLNALQDEVQYLSETHMGMTKYLAIRSATDQGKHDTQALPRCIVGPWNQIQKFSCDALGVAVRKLLEFIGDNLDVSVQPYLDQLAAVTQQSEVSF